MTKQEQRLIEAHGRLARAVESDAGAGSGDSIWNLTLITAGQGSSADYTPELLEAGAGAFPKGTKLFFKHLGFFENEQRDPRDQWGYLIEDAHYDADGEELQSKVKVLKHWREVVESLAEEEQADLSISALAAINEETGEIVGLLPHITNTVDLVGHPGRPGSRITQKAFESARAAAPDSAKPGVTSASVEEEGINMDEAKVKALIESALATALAPITSFVNESKTAKDAATQAKVDAEAVESAVTEAVTAYDEKIAAIEAADLLEPQVEELRALAREGKDITKSIESAKKVKEAAVAAVSEKAGVGNGGSFADEDWGVDL